MTATTPDLQRRRAIMKGNSVRCARAEVLRLITSRRLRFEDLLALDPAPRWLDGMRLATMLLAIPGVGPVSARRAFGMADVPTGATLKTCSPAERRRLLREVFALPVYAGGRPVRGQWHQLSYPAVEWLVVEMLEGLWEMLRDQEIVEDEDGGES